MISLKKEKSQNVTDVAYVVKTKQQLERMNKLLGTRETVYPALYVKVLGTLIQTDMWRMPYMKNVGYNVIRL